MEYENLNLENTNYAVLSGEVVGDISLSHQIEGENFLEFAVRVKRLSGSADIIPVTVSERTVLGRKIEAGKFVKVMGEYRSYNKLCSEKSKLILHLFAKEIEIFDEEIENENEVKLTGFLCKEPVYRKTPFNREICDILLAVNRTNYHKSDYIPCILWGRNARFMASQNVGCKIEVVGRIQSREYTKTLENGEVENKTAYEVSCQRISMCQNISNINAEVASEDAVNN